MHEYAVTQNIVNIVVDEARKANAAKVTEIRLVIGELSTMVDESVQMYFDIVSSGTSAEGARLVFRRVPAEFICKKCGLTFNKTGKGFNCPKCGSLSMLTGVGSEFYVESMEVEE